MDCLTGRGNLQKQQTALSGAGCKQSRVEGNGLYRSVFLCEVVSRLRTHVKTYPVTYQTRLFYWMNVNLKKKTEKKDIKCPQEQVIGKHGQAYLSSQVQASTSQLDQVRGEFSH